MKNLDSHIFLYAKGHYERSDVIKDLKVIVGQRCGIEPEDITTTDVIEVVLAVTIPHVRRSEHLLREFILGLRETRYWEVSPGQKDPYTFDKALLRRCLSVLSMTMVKGKDGEILIPLDDPDPAILPLKAYKSDGKERG